MERPIPDDTALEHPPRKKVKIDDEHNTEQNALPVSIAEAEAEQSKREHIVGITAFVSDHAGFHGILKRRYHDFIVNEIMPNGKVVRLDDRAKFRAATTLPDAAVRGKKNSKSTSDETAPSTIQVKSTTAGDSGTTGSTEIDHGGNDAPKEGQVDEVNKANGDTNADTQPSGKALMASGEKKQETIAELKLEGETLERLQKFFDSEGIEKLTTLFNNVSKAQHRGVQAYGFVDSLPIEDKDDRRGAHQIIREAFLGRIESAHQDGGLVRCIAAKHAISRKGSSKQKNQRGPAQQTPGWDKLGGDYMHFTLYKENRDGGEVLGFLSTKLKLRGQKVFDIAGNKDRRAVTSQRVSAYRIQVERFLLLNNTMTQSCVGDCSYSQDKLQLGDLAGNEFLITLRDCVVSVPDPTSTTQDSEEIKQHVRQSMQHLRDSGFINYYGLQRFGSFATRTDIVGQHMLNGDYKAAVETILEFSPQSLKDAPSDDTGTLVSSDDRRRAQAIHWFMTKTASIDDILSTLPRRFTAEYAIVSFLSRTKPPANHNYRGALEAIPRNMRSLYPHAYQSLIWNLAASHRWRLAPGKLMPGDLVYESLVPSNAEEQATYDAQGDPIYTVSTDQSDSTKVHVVTEEDIANDTYTIFDVVLPQPGFDILYPSFMLPYYREVMHEHGNLDPESMQRNWRDVSFPGSYRKLLGRPAEVWAVDAVRYTEPDAKIAITDLELLSWREQQQGTQQDRSKQEREQTYNPTPIAVNVLPTSNIAVAADIVSGPRLAILLRFQLPASTYATMALRELLKTGPVEYKPEYSGGRGL